MYANLAEYSTQMRISKSQFVFLINITKTGQKQNCAATDLQQSQHFCSSSLFANIHI